MDFNKVAIFYQSSDGGEWAMYLQSKLNTEHYSMETVLNDMIRDTSLHIRSAKLNVFVITPDFLESYISWEYLAKFDNRTSLLVLTGLDQSDLECEAVSRQRTYILDWTMHELTGEDESVRDLMVLIITLYEDYLNTPPQQAKEESSTRSDDEDYKTLPARHSKQLNSVIDVIQKSDTVYVLLERQPEGKIVIQFPYDSVVPECLSKAAVYTFNCQDIDGTSLTINQDDTKIGGGRINKRSADSVYNVLPIQFENTSSQTDISLQQVESYKENSLEKSNEEVTIDTNENKRNETTLDPSTIDKESNEVDEKTFERDNFSNMTKLDILQKLLEDETDPVRILCQALGIKQDPFELDTQLSRMVETTESLRKLSVPAIMHDVDESSHSTWPSLLHFGAQYNLKRFCSVLTRNQIVNLACHVPNRHGLLPHELAQKYGHRELADILWNIKTAESKRKENSDSEAELHTSSKVSENSEVDEVPSPNAPGLSISERNMAETMRQIDEEQPPDEDEILNEALAQHSKKLPLSKSHSDSFTNPTTEVLLPISTKEKKKGFFKKFGPGKKEKKRRFSEPSLPLNIMEQFRQTHAESVQRKQTTFHRRHSPEPNEAPPMCMGVKSKQTGDKNKSIQDAEKRLNRIFGRESINRKSMRITNALNDQSLAGPKLPHRK